MNILRVTGWSTKRAADMLPTHAIHLFILAGVSFAMPTEAVQTKSGAHSHVWKLKLKKNTRAMDMTVCVVRNPRLICLPRRAKSSPAQNGSTPPMKL